MYNRIFYSVLYPTPSSVTCHGTVRNNFYIMSVNEQKRPGTHPLYAPSMPGQYTIREVLGTNEYETKFCIMFIH